MRFLGVLILVIIIIILSLNLMTDDNDVPQFTTYDGTPITLESFAGKPHIVNLWAAWCPFCKQELPDFIALKQELGDAIEIVVINRGESREVAQTYSDALQGNEELIWLLDPHDSFYKSIGGFGMPETQFITSNGEVLIHKRGFMNLEEMRRLTEQLLNN